MQELKNRWLTQEGKKNLTNIINCLQRGNSLNTVNNLIKHAGRWDLRGAELSILAKENKIEAGSHSVSQKLGTLKLNGVNLNSIDFSFADLSYACFSKISIDNCLFNNTNAKELDVTATNFSNCIFKKTNLVGSYFNQNQGGNSGSFKNIDFIESNLSKCIFYFPIIENCTFKDCKIKETDFDGSRFKDTIFIGKIESAWFRGYAENYKKSLFELLISKKLKNIRNEMINVDFSKCELEDVLFENEINLNRCDFPNGEKYIIVKNLEKVYEKLKSIINNDWDSEYKRVALFWIENLYFSKKKQNMKVDIVNRELTSNHFPNELYSTFFNTLESVNIEINSSVNNHI